MRLPETIIAIDEHPVNVAQLCGIFEHICLDTNHSKCYITVYSRQNKIDSLIDRMLDCLSCKG